MLGQVRLYATGVLLALIALLAGYGAWQSNKAAAALAKVDTLSGQLTALQVGVDASNIAIARLDVAMDQASKKAVMVRERVIKMERDNAKVREFLDTPLPDSGCMLDDSCTTGNPQREPIDPVQTAPTTGE